MPDDQSKPMELLAPAGDQESLDAAIAAGANAVYLGLKTLNARRGARSFSAEDLPRIVATAHARNVRIYLTLNIDITQRELGQAVRMLKAATDAAVDAVLVRDPAIIHLRQYFPSIELHFSTQTCIANSADVAMAAELGANRVVLARELSLAEISACSKVAKVETEVFVQGALCFCVSGRCMLSSWAGGRSGNRGTCTSPCRVPWTADQHPLGTPLSMKDLTAVHRIADLQAAGVSSLKIEGRLKSARWVSQAVELFRKALQGGDPPTLLEQALDLGAYTGRKLTWEYLDAARDHLVAESAGRAGEPAANALTSDPQSVISDSKSQTPDPSPTYNLTIDVTDKAITCKCTIDDRDTAWTLTRTVVHRANKAVSVQKALDWLATMPVRDHKLRHGSTNSPDFLLVPRAANALPDQIAAAIRQLTKPEDDTVRVDLPEALRSILQKPTRHPANHLRMGNRPDRVRLEAKHLADFVRKVRAVGRIEAMPSSAIVEFASPDQIERLIGAAMGMPLIIALPPVFFEGDIPAVRQLVIRAVAANLPVEVNTWGGLGIARECGARIEAGPTLGIMNTLAADMLQKQDCGAVSASVELDRKQLEELTANCPARCSITVFSRPALMITRVKMNRDEILGKVLRDRRGIELRARMEHGLWTLRPIAPFDLRGTRNNAIHTTHLVVDLVASPNPADEWLQRSRPEQKPLQFNYGRSLA